VAVKTRRDSKDVVILRTLKVSGEGFHKFLSMISLRVKVGDLARTAENICRPIAIVEVDIQYHRPFDLFSFQGPSNGERHVIEIAESSAGVWAGVVTERSVKPEGRLPITGEFRRFDGPSHNQHRYGVGKSVVLFHILDMAFCVAEPQIRIHGRIRLFKFKGCLEGSADGLDSAWGRDVVDYVE